MQFAGRHIQTAEKIIGAYDGSIPFHHFLKQFFAADKKYGSKDRKNISHACYCYFRSGKALAEISIQEKIKAGIFLCDATPGTWESVFDEEWLAHWNTDLEKRMEFINQKLSFNLDDVFPLGDELSNDIEATGFTASHFIQPDLFLRTRPGKKEKVTSQLMAASISFNELGEDCIALPNATKIDQLLSVNKDVVVQDLSSQRIKELLSPVNYHLSSIKVWDCCAASGGKSILAYDTFDGIQLTVSDVRSSIIQNLEKRFSEAGIKNYRSFVADISGNQQLPSDKFDMIICDVPCSGSGTWGRTPEQLSFFKTGKIQEYADLQKKITTNVIPSLKKNGYLLYITCSVFRKENEDVVEYIKSNTSLQLAEMRYLKGYDKKADTMFAALFTASTP